MGDFQRESASEPAVEPDRPSHELDAELSQIVNEEQLCLVRVIEHVQTSRSKPPVRAHETYSNYDAQLLALRDEMVSTRLEDLPPLLEQMERLQSIADRRRKDQNLGTVDVRSPYFGRLVLDENGRQREVLIGRSTYLDTQSGIRIVDWRDAPVSRLYYRYQEGDEYSENFGGRDTEGEVLTRRSLTIAEGQLRRIGCPQGAFARTSQGEWRRLDATSRRLHGGEGAATRPEARGRGVLGVGDATLSDDKSLREITALIDPHQFDLITRTDSGLVVIQGGAGSGKTTIGLHRLAYLSYRDQRRFRAERMLVVVFNEALCRYISQVLPSLGVEGVAIRTYSEFATKLRLAHFEGLTSTYSADTPSSVSKLKKHPLMLRLIDTYVSDVAREFESGLQAVLERNAIPEGNVLLTKAWKSNAQRPLRHRIYQVRSAASRNPDSLSLDSRVALERIVAVGLRKSRDIVTAWADILSDLSRLRRQFDEYAPGTFSQPELTRAHEWCTTRCTRIVSEIDRVREEATQGNQYHPRVEFDTDDDDLDDDRRFGIDGRQVDETTSLDREDDTLLLRLHQKLKGPLMRGAKSQEALIYEHILVDEAQDYSPVELALVLDMLSPGRSITLAGDTAQRLLMDNGFSDWRTVLADLGLSHVEIEPLRLGYRSTQEITDVAHSVLGKLASEEKGIAVRSGAPVELFQFAHSGDAAGFLAEQLRALMHAEPRASVAVIARFPEQADAYFDVLEKGEVPRLRRIADQDFPFRPGVDVTDVRQVKGLEFDYVIIVEADTYTFPETDEARHLLHIAMTRAAHQLWLAAAGEPSRLLPLGLRERAL
jgi:DNA helicase II / ATP-dependent DNA helicase PcrA